MPFPAATSSTLRPARRSRARTAAPRQSAMSCQRPHNRLRTRPPVVALSAASSDAAAGANAGLASKAERASAIAISLPGVKEASGCGPVLGNNGREWTGRLWAALDFPLRRA
jgi:hypothetical protein